MKKIALLLTIISSFVQAGTSFTDIAGGSNTPDNSNPIQAPDAVLAGLTVYPSLASFQAGTIGATLTVEDFSNTLTPGVITTCGEVVNSVTATPCFAVGNLQAGFTLIANDDNADTAKDVVFIGNASLGNTIDLIGANSFTDSTEIQFSATDINAVAFDTSVAFAAADVTITAFDTGNVAIGSFNLSIAALPGIEFAGFSTGATPISKVTIVGAGGEGELIGNLMFGTLAPPKPIPMFSTLTLVLLSLFIFAITFISLKRKA